VAGQAAGKQTERQELELELEHQVTPEMSRQVVTEEMEAFQEVQVEAQGKTGQTEQSVWVQRLVGVEEDLEELVDME
jgi:hypothetical protein